VNLANGLVDGVIYALWAEMFIFFNTSPLTVFQDFGDFVDSISSKIANYSATVTRLNDVYF